MLDRITAPELGELLEFLQSEPVGEDRADFRAAMGCFIAARAAGAKNTRLSDYLPKWGDEDSEPQTREEMDAAFRQMAGLIAAQQKG